MVGAAEEDRGRGVELAGVPRLPGQVVVEDERRPGLSGQDASAVDVLKTARSPM